MKSFEQSAKHEKEWYLLDCTDKVLGRFATQIARVLSGKHKPQYTPYLDTGDYVVVVNAAKLRVTGSKLEDKYYYRYSGYQSGLKQISLKHQLAKDATAVIKEAVRGMLPKGPLGRAMLKKLKVYAGAKHDHQAQAHLMKQLTV